MADKLKPCPFCGGEAYIAHRKGAYDFWNYYCGCVDCGVETLGYDREKEAIKKWNNRHSPWHIFNDWSDAPDCDVVIVTIENRFGQRFVTEAWWSVGSDCKCNWYAIDRRYAENWREGIYLLSQNWKVVAWMYRPEPYILKEYPYAYEDYDEEKEI